MLFHHYAYFALALAHQIAFVLILHRLAAAGHIRRMLLLFLFCVLTGTLATISLADSLLHFLPVPEAHRLYWINEILEQYFAMVLMVATMRMALNGRRPGALIRLSLASALLVAVAALLTDGTPALSNKWMTGFTRNLSFGVALMNFYI
ncbi:MAG: hypothetical protein FJW31_26720 [Acidobacteria bacterium]|nr:hypothetical protein [Acidobacteriota bacterium]